MVNNNIQRFLLPYCFCCPTTKLVTMFIIERNSLPPSHCREKSCDATSLLYRLLPRTDDFLAIVFLGNFDKEDRR